MKTKTAIALILVFSGASLAAYGVEIVEDHVCLSKVCSGKVSDECKNPVQGCLVSKCVKCNSSAEGFICWAGYEGDECTLLPKAAANILRCGKKINMGCVIQDGACACPQGFHGN